MISLSECAPCKAKRLQEESEREFRKRFGMIDLNRQPRGMGWKRFMGQAVVPTTVAPSVAPAPDALTLNSYFDAVKDRSLGYGMGLIAGVPIGLLVRLIFGADRTRQEGLITAGIAATLGAFSVLLPFKKNNDTAAFASIMSGGFTGSGLSSLILPSKKSKITGAPSW
jgi:hypothetical protein